MNEQDRDLIAQVLKAAGQAGEKGFEYLVHYTVVNGVTDLITIAATLPLLAFLFTRLLAWKPKEGFDKDIAYAVRGLSIAIVCIVALAFISCIGDAISKVFAPEGAAIHSVLK